VREVARFIRSFHWNAGAVGLRFGMILLFFAIPGGAFGGLISSVLQSRAVVDANPIVGIFSTLILLPAGILGPLQNDPWSALVGFA
jgi:MFS-type transporter involved in bile tolerance (Atg22 family)